jgi:hypothetical protein
MPVEQLLQQLKTESEMNPKKSSAVATWPSSQPLPLPEAAQPPAAAQPPPAPTAPVKKQ